MVYVPGNRMTTLQCDVCVVGLGSGGLGAALAAARAGANVAAIDKNQVVGGTTTMAWVHVWQPVSGASGLPEELWQRMSRIPGATSGLDYAKGEPGGLLATEDGRTGRALVFEPWAYDWCARELLGESGNCQVLLGTSLAGVEIGADRIEAIEAERLGDRLRICAAQYVDATGDGTLCVAAGCPWRMGEEPRSLYGESLAPEEPGNRLNGMTLMYRIHDTGTCQRPWLPAGLPADYCTGLVHPTRLPNGDLLVNRCGMVTGDPLAAAHSAELLAEARRRMHANFYWMQTEAGYQTWTLSGVAPELGVRESRRILGDYVLREHDCRAGLARQSHSDIVALCDHTLDMHGPGGYDIPVRNGTYGIPYRCLCAQKVDNVLVACRALSCSHVASSSVRLQRTLMKIGEAGGTAAAMAACSRTAPRDLDVAALQARLGVGLAIEQALARTTRPIQHGRHDVSHPHKVHMAVPEKA